MSMGPDTSYRKRHVNVKFWVHTVHKSCRDSRISFSFLAFWSFHLYLMLSLNPSSNPSILWPEGSPGSSDISTLSGISGQSFDSIFLSALLLFCPSPVASSVFSFLCFWPSSPAYFQKFLETVF